MPGFSVILTLELCLARAARRLFLLLFFFLSKSALKLGVAASERGLTTAVYMYECVKRQAIQKLIDGIRATNKSKHQPRQISSHPRPIESKRPTPRLEREKAKKSREVSSLAEDYYNAIAAKLRSVPPPHGGLRRHSYNMNATQHDRQQRE